MFVRSSVSSTNNRTYFDLTLLRLFSSLAFSLSALCLCSKSRSVCCETDNSSVLRDSSRMSSFGSFKCSFFSANDCCHSLNCSFRRNSFSINALNFYHLIHRNKKTNVQSHLNAVELFFEFITFTYIMIVMFGP